MLYVVLIPLLLDDPLWDSYEPINRKSNSSVLIPLLLDDPLWEYFKRVGGKKVYTVLIPLLLDDPLWEFKNYSMIKDTYKS